MADTPPYDLDVMLASRRAVLGIVPVKACWLGNSIVANGQRMIDRLTKLSGGRIVNLRNAGVAGRDTDQIIAAMATDIHPDAQYVFVNEGSNNAQHAYWATKSYTDMVTIATYIKSLGKIPVICASPPADDYVSYSTRYCYAHRLAAEDTGAIFVDPWRRWRGTDGKYGAGFSTDKVHPITTVQFQLYDWAAEDIWAQLRPAIGVPDPMLPISNAGEGAYSKLHYSGNALLLGGTTGWARTSGAVTALTTQDAPDPWRGNEVVLDFTAGIASGSETVTRMFIWNGDTAQKPAVGNVLRLAAVIGVEGLANARVVVDSYTPNGAAASQIMLDTRVDRAREAYAVDIPIAGAAGSEYSIRVTITASGGSASGKVTLSNTELFNLTLLKTTAGA